MKSYVVITRDRETGEVKIQALLKKEEKVELLSIRHFLVEQINRMVNPQPEKGE